MTNFKKFTIEEGGETEITDNTGDMAKQTDKMEELQELFDYLNKNGYAYFANNSTEIEGYSEIGEFKNLFNEAITQDLERAFDAAREREWKEDIGASYLRTEDGGTKFPENKYENFTEYNKTQKLIT